VLQIGLTGGIGAGKTVVARRLAELGALVVDADALAREVVEPGTAGLDSVVAEFGSGVLAADGSLDRAALAKVVFGDDAARARLNAIVHPLVGRRAAELIAAAPPGAVVVQDVPLLVETGAAGRYDLVVVVEAPEEVRVGRLARDRGMAAEEARARIAAQASDAERRAVADVVLVNDGDLDALRTRVDRVWADRVEPLRQP
jgi:dephospho-CoA kinase